MVNVEGDSIGAGIVAHLSKKELAFLDDEDVEDHMNGDVETAFVNTGFAKDDIPSYGTNGHFVVPAITDTE